MKKFILLSLLSILISTSIHAQTVNDDCCYEGFSFLEGNNFYGKILGGGNFLQITDRHLYQPKFKTGYILSGSLGYRCLYGLRVEAEYAFRKNSVKNDTYYNYNYYNHGHIAYPMTGHFQSSSYMANLLWDLPFSQLSNCWNIQPFIGAGIGYDKQRIKVSIHDGRNTYTGSASKKQFAWQLIAGVVYPVFSNTDISLEYNLHKGVSNDVYNHSVGFGLTYNFG